MKILIISHKVCAPPRGGSTLRMFNLLKESAKQNEIVLLTFNQDRDLVENGTLSDSIATLKKLCREVEVFDVPSDGKPFQWYGLLGLNLFSSTPYSVWRFHSPRMEERIRHYLNREKFDIIQTDTIALAPYALLAKDIPRVLVHENTESQLLERRAHSIANPLTRNYMLYQAGKLKRYEQKVAPWFARHTTVSALDKQLLEQQCPGLRAVVIDNGVDTDFFAPSGHGGTTRTLVFAGSLTWYPNNDAMLLFWREIWPIIAQADSKVEMDLIGSHPPEELVQAGHNDPRFHVRGFVDDVRPFIDRASVYVVPIRVGGGTRLKILDAMAMGKAVVSHSIGAEGLDVTNGRDIIIADDPKEFAQATLRLLNDPEERARLGRAARETALNRYSWTIIGPRLQKMYDEIVSERASAGVVSPTIL